MLSMSLTISAGVSAMDSYQTIRERHQKAEDRIYVCKIKTKYVLSKIYNIDNSKSNKSPHLDLHCFRIQPFHF